MTRSWLTFAFALLLLLSPLRLLWAHPGASPWALTGVWAVLVVAGVFLARRAR